MSQVDFGNNEALVKIWIGATSVDSLRVSCTRENGEIEIPLSLKSQLYECLRYSKSILDLYYMENEAYNNWLFMLLDVVYLEVFNARCFKAGQQDCKFKQLLHQLDSLFSRVDQSTFLRIG